MSPTFFKKISNQQTSKISKWIFADNQQISKKKSANQQSANSKTSKFFFA